MTNYEWLDINKLYDTFTKDSIPLDRREFICNYRIPFNPKCDIGVVEVVLRWLKSKHTELKKCVDKDALLEYIEDNDTSNNEQYYRIRIDDFLKFIYMLDVHEIEV